MFVVSIKGQLHAAKVTNIAVNSIPAKNVLKALKALRKEGKGSLRKGICRRVADQLRSDNAANDYIARQFLQHCSKLYTGSKEAVPYPVNFPGSGKSGEYLYDTRQYFWDKNTKYGAARHKYLEFCIAELEKLIKASEVLRELERGKIEDRARMLHKEAKDLGFNLHVDYLYVTVTRR